MEVNINNEALDDYGQFYSSVCDEEFHLVKAFKNKGVSDDVLYDIKRISLLLDTLHCQKIIANGDD